MNKTKHKKKLSINKCKALYSLCIIYHINPDIAFQIKFVTKAESGYQPLTSVSQGKLNQSPDRNAETDLRG